MPAVNSFQRTWPAGRQIAYVIEAAESAQGQRILLSVPFRERKVDGDWGKFKFEDIRASQVSGLADADDRKILGIIFGAANGSSSYYDYASGCRFNLRDALAETLLPTICRTGRCSLRQEPAAEPEPLVWDENENGPWTFALKWSRTENGKSYQIAGILRRGDEIVEITQPRLVTHGFVFWKDRVAPLVIQGDFRWLDQFRRTPVLQFPVEQRGPWLQQFFRLPGLPRLDRCLIQRRIRSCGVTVWRRRLTTG